VGRNESPKAPSLKIQKIQCYASMLRAALLRASSDRTAVITKGPEKCSRHNPGTKRSAIPSQTCMAGPEVAFDGS
jgi:hypothetical protein